jgi:hypothetical protein
MEANPARLPNQREARVWPSLHARRSNDRFGSMLLKKDYEGGLLATLIQDQEQMRNHDSRNHLPEFVRFNF